MLFLSCPCFTTCVLMFFLSSESTASLGTYNMLLKALLDTGGSKVLHQSTVGSALVRKPTAIVDFMLLLMLTTITKQLFPYNHFPTPPPPPPPKTVVGLCPWYSYGQQALGGVPLGLEMVIEDEPSKFSFMPLS